VSVLIAPEELPVMAALDALDIPYERYEHAAVASAVDAEEHWTGIDAVHCKNLFLRNQKGTRHYLVILKHLKRADLRAVANQIGDGKLSFGSPERLMAHLGVTPGSVSPFGLIHDVAHDVRVCLDRDLKTTGHISFHPNINTATLVIAFADFERFLASRHNPVQYVTI
jgi:Ala-tRNA(Pro) deacylase